MLLKYSYYSFKEKFFSKKTLTIALVGFFSEHLFLNHIGEFCIAVDEKITPYVFPFLISYIYFQLIYTMMVLYYFSDVPFLQYNQMYQITRMGTVKWTLGKIGYILMSSAALTLIVVSESILILLPHMKISNEWGKILYTLSMTNVQEDFKIYPLPFNKNYMEQFSVVEGMMIAFLVCMAVTSFLGILMFFISLWLGRVVAIIAASFEIACPIISMNLLWKASYIISCISPVCWLQVVEYGAEKYGNRIMPQMNVAFISLGFIILFLIAGVMLRIKKYEFYWSREE